VPVVGAPALFERLGRPGHPRELAGYPAITYSHVRPSNRWHFVHAEQGECTVEVSGPIRSNNGDVILDALIAGVGVAPLPDFIGWQALADGRLEAVLPEWSRGGGALHLVTPPTALRPARVRVLIDFLAAAFLKPPWAVTAL